MKSFAVKYGAPALVAITLVGQATTAFGHGLFQGGHIHPGERCRVVPHEHSNKSHAPGQHHRHGGNGANQTHQHDQVRRANNGQGWTNHTEGGRQRFDGRCRVLNHNG